MTLAPTTLTLDADRVIADVDPRVFGGLLEHMGRAVYEGVFDPTSPHADEHGCRTDVLEALAGLHMTAMRYPGGNFVSGYDWRDGVGPVDRRPTRAERAWRSLESNRFGTDEFLALSERMGWTPMMAVNLGTGTPEEAQALLAYCNAPTGTAMGDWRAEHGRPEPYGVDLWCLGNEMDGIWQIGHTTVGEYVDRARAAAGAMREVDPSIEVVACGSSDPNLPHFPRWDRTVLTDFGTGLDYLSVHRYARNFTRNTPQFLATGVSVDRQIEQLDAISQDAARRNGFGRPTRLSFDEWNVWYRKRVEQRLLLPARWGGHAPHLLEETYNLEDALVVAGFLNSFIRHADVVRIANLAQIVNVIAPLRTRGDDLLIQSTYHAFRMFSSRRDGDALRVGTAGPTYDTRRVGTVPFVDASAIRGEGVLHVFAVNRSVDEAAPLELAFSGPALRSVRDAEILTGSHAQARNTFADQAVVHARPFESARPSGQSAELVLPPLSLVAASFALDTSGEERNP